MIYMLVHCVLLHYAMLKPCASKQQVTDQYSELTSCCFFSLFKCCSSIVPLPPFLSLIYCSMSHVWQTQGYRAVLQNRSIGLQIQTPAFHIYVAVCVGVCVCGGFSMWGCKTYSQQRELFNNTGTLVPSFTTSQL